MKNILLASNNPGKLREIGAMLAPLRIEVIPQRLYVEEEAEETGFTFIENALIKARHACRCSGLAAIADDSGLEVEKLGGAPGIYSARYAGKDATDRENNIKLLDAMCNLGEGARQAKFRCVMVYLRHEHDPSPIIAEGVWSGEICMQMHGDGGFGYDPLFYVPSLGTTVAQMSDDMKNQYSHRSIALNRLMEQMKGL